MRTITIMGNPTATVVDLSEPTGPRPAVGKHAELLEDITQAANAVLRLIEAERSGVCDGQGFWVGSDPILDAAASSYLSRMWPAGLREDRTTNKAAASAALGRLLRMGLIALLERSKKV